MTCVAASSRAKRRSKRTRGRAEDGENDAQNVLEALKGPKDVIIGTSGHELKFFRSRIEINWRATKMMLLHSWLRPYVGMAAV